MSLSLRCNMREVDLEEGSLKYRIMAAREIWPRTWISKAEAAAFKIQVRGWILGLCSEKNSRFCQGHFPLKVTWVRSRKIYYFPQVTKPYRNMREVTENWRFSQGHFPLDVTWEKSTFKRGHWNIGLSLKSSIDLQGRPWGWAFTLSLSSSLRELHQNGCAVSFSGFSPR